jgi:CheY-like chemotaxis protein
MHPCIVVIEDEPDLRTMLLDVLKLNGFKAVGVSRPELVQTIDWNQRPDLFLVDMSLPGQTGIELARQLRRQGYADTPMIAMSANDDMLEVAAESHLFQSTLHKPFNVPSLLHCVERYAA